MARVGGKSKGEGPGLYTQTGIHQRFHERNCDAAFWVDRTAKEEASLLTLVDNLQRAKAGGAFQAAGVTPGTGGFEAGYMRKVHSLRNGDSTDKPDYLKSKLSTPARAHGVGVDASPRTAERAAEIHASPREPAKPDDDRRSQFSAAASQSARTTLTQTYSEASKARPRSTATTRASVLEEENFRLESENRALRERLHEVESKLSSDRPAPSVKRGS